MAENREKTHQNDALYVRASVHGRLFDSEDAVINAAEV